ncbi:Knottin [Macleaya cordata]|uniref:Knottin n=1 Tax=Macleaya cordata TaxID=56857 RepID=A0A200Q6U3_MACCD|nr:Knottin [Macleaya cordata]
MATKVMMMKSASTSFFALIFIFFLLTTSGNAAIKAGGDFMLDDLCEKASQTWSGNCGNTQHCDRQCINWEKALHGACHVRGGKHMCFCYFSQC